MKNISLICLCLLISSMIMAQNKFSVTLNSQIGVYANENNPQSINQFESSYLDESFTFSPAIAYGVGLSFNYAFSERLTGRLGVDYLKNNEEIFSYNIYGGAHHVSTDISHIKSSPYDQFHFPLTIVWRLGQGKYVPFLGGGILLNKVFRSRETGSIRIQDPIFPNKYKIRNQLIANAGLSIHRKLNIEFQYIFGVSKAINYYFDFVHYPCAVMADEPIIGPCGNYMSAYTQSVFRSFLGLRIGYQL